MRKFNTIFLSTAKTIFLLSLMITSSACVKHLEPDSNYTYQVATVKRAHILGLERSLEKFKNATFQFSSTISNFQTNPSSVWFIASKEAWKSTFAAYMELRMYFSENQTIDGAFSQILNLNQGPIDPSFLDYTSASPNGGMVAENGQFPELSISNLEAYNKVGGETNICLGLKAIEFMLWGEDNNINIPGDRSHLDYASDANKERRFQLLRSMVMHMMFKVNQINFNALKANWERENQVIVFNYMIEPLIEVVKIEFAQKGLANALASSDPKDEFADFSDDSFNQLKMMAVSLKEVLDARANYKTHPGFFLIDFIKEVNEEVGNNLEKQP